MAMEGKMNDSASNMDLRTNTDLLCICGARATGGASAVHLKCICGAHYSSRNFTAKYTDKIGHKSPFILKAPKANLKSIFFKYLSD